MNLGEENESREFRKSFNQLDKGIKSLTAMLNRNGHGTVYFGVDKNGNVKGFPVGRKAILDIRDRIRDIVEPCIYADIRICQADDGNTYIAVSAAGKDIPYSCGGRYYIRNASVDEIANTDMLRRMLAAGDADLIKQIESDNQELTFTQLFSFLSDRSIHVSDNRLALHNYGLFNMNDKYNLMAYLLSDQNDIGVKINKYDGIDKASVSESSIYEKQCLLITVKQVMDYIKTLKMNQNGPADETCNYTDRFEWKAFREAWINACVHNSWFKRIPPSIDIFNDRIEIVSCGELPYGLSENGFFRGVSKPVNKALMTLFNLSGFSELSGHGVPTVVSAYGKEAFSFDDGLLRITLKFASGPVATSSENVPEHRQTKLTINQRKICEYLSEHPTATLRDAADTTGLSLGGVKKIMSKLQELKIMRRSGSKKDGRWEMVDFIGNL